MQLPAASPLIHSKGGTSPLHRAYSVTLTTLLNGRHPPKGVCTPPQGVKVAEKARQEHQLAPVRSDLRWSLPSPSPSSITPTWSWRALEPVQREGARASAGRYLPVGKRGCGAICIRPAGCNSCLATFTEMG